MRVCRAEQSEIGGAGGGLTGEQVDTHTHTQTDPLPDRTLGFTFTPARISCEISDLLERKLPAIA